MFLSEMKINDSYAWQHDKFLQEKSSSCLLSINPNIELLMYHFSN